MTAQHTPGPWTLQPCKMGDTLCLVRANVAGYAKPQKIAEVVDMGAQGDANARLIAAAPDLLSALRDIVDLQGKAANGLPLSENEVRDWAVANHTARAAIAKAEGL